MFKLENSRCRIVYNPNYESKIDCFNGEDLTDSYNDPAFYNTTVQGHKKAWEALKEAFTNTTTMGEVQRILWNNGIKTRQWCQWD